MNFIPDSFKIKHDLLGLLKSQMKGDIPEDIKLSQIAKTLKVYDKKLLYDHLYVLDENKDIVFVSTDEDPKFMITKQGVKSFIDKVYLESGKTHILNRSYDYGKNILVLIAVATFSLSVYQGCNNKKALNKQEMKLDTLEKQVNSLKNYHNSSPTNIHNPKTDQQYLQKGAQMDTIKARS